MTEKPFDPSKPCRSRDGRAVRIICTDVRDRDFTIVALVDNGRGNEHVRHYKSNGASAAGGRSDYLVNIPERVSRWTKIYPDMRFATFWAPDMETCRGNSVTAALAYLELITEDGRPVAAHIHPGDVAQP